MARGIVTDWRYWDSEIDLGASCTENEIFEATDGDS